MSAVAICRYGMCCHENSRECSYIYPKTIIISFQTCIIRYSNETAELYDAKLVEFIRYHCIVRFLSAHSSRSTLR
jgi:hypothetical protein